MNVATSASAAVSGNRSDSAPPLKVALLWHTFGQGNLGVDALTRANAEIIRSAAERSGRTAHFTTLGFGKVDKGLDLPLNTTIGDGPRIKRMLSGRSDFLRTLREADLVVDIGEGDSWADMYGTRRYLLQAGSKVAALAFNRPLVLAPQTIGPFSNGLRRSVANRIMNRAASVFARDTLSMEYLKAHRISAPTAEYIDVAFRLPFEQRPREGSRIQVGLNVSGLLYRQGYSGNNEFGMQLDYAALSHAMIEAFLARGDVDVHLVPHVLGRAGSNDNDLAMVSPLTTQYPALKVAPVFGSASEAKSYMSALDFVVAGRMHACIGAFSAGVPVVPIAYSRKFNGLFGTLGYPYFVDGKAEGTEAALEKTLHWFDRRDELRSSLKAGLTLAETRLAAYEDQLAALIAGLPVRR